MSPESLPSGAWQSPASPVWPILPSACLPAPATSQPRPVVPSRPTSPITTSTTSRTTRTPPSSSSPASSTSSWPWSSPRAGPSGSLATGTVRGPAGMGGERLAWGRPEALQRLTHTHTHRAEQRLVRGRSWGSCQREALTSKRHQVRPWGAGSGRGPRSSFLTPLSSPDLFVISVVALYAFALTILLHPVAAIESFLEVGGGPGPQPLHQPPPQQLSPPWGGHSGSRAGTRLGERPGKEGWLGTPKAGGDTRMSFSPVPGWPRGAPGGGASTQPLPHHLSVLLLHSWSACLTPGGSRFSSLSSPTPWCPCWWR